MKTISVLENTLIGSEDQWLDPPKNGVLVPDGVFQSLRRFAFENDTADGLLTFSVQKGREVVQVRNYVGLLPLSNRNQLEILPKISAIGQERNVLLAMLKHLRHSPFRTLADAQTRAVQLPLWETFILAFLDSVALIVQQGIQRAYVPVERNERFWKGKLQVARQQRENAAHAERLAVVYDTFTANTAPNRLLKTTLLYLNSRTANQSIQRSIGQLSRVLDEVPVSPSIPDDLRAVRRAGALFLRYAPALRWAEALLSGQGLGVQTGRVPGLALLFPMERVFEAYVAHGIRTHWPDANEVRLQESSAHLVDEHAGIPKFKLRPDIIIRHQDKTMVMDTKWKLINAPIGNAASNSGNYGIEQADLYQLYAYGKKYAANDLFLIYPAGETFCQPLPVFDYDATTRLHVVPFDVTRPLAHEVEKLARYALPG